MNPENIMILGYGVSGKAAARLALFLGKNIIIVDEKDGPEIRAEAAALKGNVKTFFGWTKEVELPESDLIVASPGIKEKSPVRIESVKKCKGKLISELSFAFRHLPCPIVGITGTNGKTTTTEITTELFKAVGLKAESAGNIGTALSDAAIEAIRGNIKLLTVEVSSFQLETIEDFSPSASAILNVASDHIDRHGDIFSYAATKFRIFDNTPKNASARIINSNMKCYWEKFMPDNSNFTSFSAEDTSADFTLIDNSITFKGRKIFPFADSALKGKHNAENMMAALALLRSVSGDDALFDKRTIQALKDFRPDFHRLEVFAEKNGVLYVNDSKATNPHAVNAAIETFAKGKNIIIILGGLDKNMDFSELIPYASKIKKAFIMGQCGQKIYEIMTSKTDCTMCGSFEDAVSAACKAASPGDCVMLSPATASMDMFKNYRERGDRFKALVKSLI